MALASAGAALAQTSTATAPTSSADSPHAYGFGSPVTDDELKQFTSPLPDGRGLPPGSGTVMQGEKVYTQQCLACHGANLEGGIGDRLIGGRGTLAKSDKGGAPIKTVESYWPYSTTLFDYIKRAMPFTMPNSMSDDDVYAVTAYILYKANIIPQDATMDKDSLPKVAMPNRDAFKPAGR
ncbi:cytochrome c [Parapusillimonas sp. SGNA-6]|nr:cytochrome c [Parapusillimonas sp. SGNA-6]